uniref:GPI mannosyltransferase 1 n=1 Tax=Percolomonas cosmopolitus TaxID=63605 RepID=A0A7S1KRH2_9EUKA
MTFPQSLSKYITPIVILFASSFLFRILIILLTSSYDSKTILKYTDVDYFVFNDAARFVYEDRNSSPYLRKTYRYTPLLAYLLVPNHFFGWDVFGKVVFCGVDLLIAWLVLSIGRMREMEIIADMPRRPSPHHFQKRRTMVPADGDENTHKEVFRTTTPHRIPLSSWLTVLSLTTLFNPIVFNISTRGNADQLVLALVLAALYMFHRRRYMTCALLYGLSVHFKIYPIIYAPVFYLAIADRKFNPSGRVYPAKSIWAKLRRTITLIGRGLLSAQLWMFTLVSAGVVLGLGALFYHLYGYECIYETYLYHLIRSDNRHNFSVYFYHIYLSVMAPKSFTALLMFVPQMMVLLLMALFMYRNILECILVQTMAFVAFNKVCTVQYFVWYIPLFSFLLLRSIEKMAQVEELNGDAAARDTSAEVKSAGHAVPLPQSEGKRLIFNVGTCIVIWFIAQALWLQSAYELEFLGRNTFLRVWVFGLFFFVSNIGIIMYVLLSKGRQRVTTKRKQE